jgi:hypothetical protein
MELPIWTKYESLDSGFCRHVIEKFEKDENKHDGYVGNGTVDKNIKSSIDLNITGYPEWKHENDEFQVRLREGMLEYRNYLIDINPRFSPVSSQIRDSGFQIQRTDPGCGYTWHSDSQFYCEANNGIVTTNIRTLTYIFYLNNVPKVDGGYTEFVDGTQIVPDQGKLLFFPATWEYIHRGFPPQTIKKYICTGWIYDVVNTPIKSSKMQMVPPAEQRNNYVKVQFPNP